MATHPSRAASPTPKQAPDQNAWDAPAHVKTLVLLMATAFGIYVCYLLAEPFLSALTWAVVLAVLFAHAHHWIESKLRHASLAAAISVATIALIVVVPAIFVGHRLVVQVALGAELIQTKVSSGEWRRAIEAQPRLVPIFDRIEQAIDLPGTTKTIATWLSTTAGSFVTGSVFQVLAFCLIFYLLFFFLRDRHAALDALRTLLPLSRRETDHLLSRISDTIFATVYGTLTVSTVQGILGGLMFWWLGLPAALLWGVVMALLAVVPVLGAFVVWIPAALFLILEGSWGKGLILMIWGMLVVGTVDNLLRPVLVGKRLQLHTVFAFLAVIGGLLLFGPSGLILGPVAFTTTTALLAIWRTRSAALPAAR